MQDNCVESHTGQKIQVKDQAQTLQQQKQNKRIRPKKYKQQQKTNINILNLNNLTIVDLECFQNLQVSEVGAVRIYKGQIVAQLHSLVKQEPKIPDNSFYGSLMTKIQYSHVTNGMQQSDIKQLLQEFSTLSSDELKSYNTVKLFSKFQQEKATYMAKGPGLERQITKFAFQDSDIFIKQDRAFYHGTERSDIDWCDFHKTVEHKTYFRKKNSPQPELMHCALDDCYVVAKAIVKLSSETSLQDMQQIENNFQK
ncbi:hypothetical protein SS50377_26102 [Spironucleus salmonicida]|uniref:Uncharacterized protein n=1 Tax=Spironucleus salmonicida TaxID=348837 RepID=V6LTY3_9EUKA|nr:hypothetical protein SS50377_26102 [Spironucleus salmonicida]|eukprot:EST48127.1 Hypothetical protein SS50377_11727 [Spironucleus salmonicida]